MKISKLFYVISIIGISIFGFNIRGALNGWINNIVLLSTGLLICVLALFFSFIFAYIEYKNENK